MHVNVCDPSTISSEELEEIMGFGGLGLRDMSNDVTIWCQMSTKDQGRFSIDRFHKEPQTHVQRSSFSYIHSFSLYSQSIWNFSAFGVKEDPLVFAARSGIIQPFIANWKLNQKNKHLGKKHTRSGFRILLVWAICCSVVIAFKSGAVECHLHKLHKSCRDHLVKCEMVSRQNSKFPCLAISSLFTCWSVRSVHGRKCFCFVKFVHMRMVRSGSKQLSNNIRISKDSRAVWTARNKLVRW